MGQYATVFSGRLYLDTGKSFSREKALSPKRKNPLFVKT
jgi:hypothetical protein